MSSSLAVILWVPFFNLTYQFRPLVLKLICQSEQFFSLLFFTTSRKQGFQIFFFDLNP